MVDDSIPSRRTEGDLEVVHLIERGAICMASNDTNVARVC
jgi:hypothetical protein